MIGRSKRKVVGLLLSALVVGACLLLPGAARAAATLDQQQDELVYHGEGGCCFAYWGAAAGRTAQTFTAGISGSLSRVRLMLGTKGTSGSVVVQIADTSAGLPVDGALASATIPAAGLPGVDTLGWVDVNFAAPAQITAGHEYAVVVRNDIPQFLYWGGSDSDVYARGAALFGIDLLGEWKSDANADFVFETYVEPTPPAAQFLEPLTQSTSAGTIANTAKNGRVVPLKVQLREDGAALTESNAPGPVTLSVTDQGACASGGATDAVDVYAAGSSASAGSALRYDAIAGAWVYNLDTKAMRLTSGHCYRLDVSVNGVQATNAWVILEPVK